MTVCLETPFLWLAVFVVVVLQLLAAYFSPLAAVLGTVAPRAIDWVVICSSGLLVIAIVEVAKLIFRHGSTRINSDQIAVRVNL